jgi:hypothetical protein
MKGLMCAACLLVLSASQVRACGPTIKLFPDGPVCRTLADGAELTRDHIDFANGPRSERWVPGSRLLQAPLRLAAYPFFTGYVILREGRERLVELRAPYGKPVE